MDSWSRNWFDRPWSGGSPILVLKQRLWGLYLSRLGSVVLTSPSKSKQIPPPDCWLFVKSCIWFAHVSLSMTLNSRGKRVQYNVVPSPTNREKRFRVWVWQFCSLQPSKAVAWWLARMDGYLTAIPLSLLWIPSTAVKQGYILTIVTSSWAIFSSD